MSTFDAETEAMIEANRVNWDARTPIHVVSSFYGLDGSRPAAGWFADYEWVDLPELAGVDVLHLQCHLGTETLAFAEKGARPVGLDISGESVREAGRLAAERGLDISYVRADVYDAADALGRRTFDVVYTGKGAVCYLPELDPWAAVVAELLRPGGCCYLVEFHPLLYSLGVVPPADGDQGLTLRGDYLAGRGADRRDATFTYTDGPALTEGTVAYEWRHGVGEVVTALAGAGLRIERVREDPRLPWPRWPSMERDPDGWWSLPAEAPRIPLLYAVLARKP
ncbi:class I SAM-dependent methyltransferase [Actinophytocola xanthii]|uniref:SAM-dependent methyltransferase n=1 Tax=Actinophytocola xanthii TaxID=1912961 RepID=A0A1Q8CLP1_9PSEU|nr:class I SAM-dependent methyltransferase [Actinophytocola xanthii]OLF15278.1 SAM-dependent methyltransferase [Actinophytocola xanthii]